MTLVFRETSKMAQKTDEQQMDEQTYLRDGYSGVPNYPSPL